MIITSVEQGKKNKSRFNIYIDGKYSFSISEDDYFKIGLYEEKEISQEEINYILENINYNRAKNMALKFILRKHRTCKEVFDKIISLDYDEATAQTIIKEFQSLRYLDDYDFAIKYIKDRLNLKPKSIKLIKFELQSKGIDNNILEEAFNQFEIDELSTIKNIIQKRFSKYDLTDKAIIKKIHSFFYNKGYGYSTIDAALREYLDDFTA